MNKLCYMSMLIASLFGWTKFYDGLATQVTSIRESPTSQFCISGYQNLYSDSVEHFFLVFDQTGHLINTDSCLPDSVSSYVLPYPDEMLALDNGAFCCAVTDFYAAESCAGVVVADSALNPLSRLVFTPPVLNAKAHDITLTQYDVGEILVLIDYYLTSQIVFIHALRINCTCSVLDEMIIEGCFAGRTGTYNSQTCIVEEDGSFIFSGLQYLPDSTVKVIIEASFTDSFRIAPIERRIPYEFPMALYKTSSDDFLVLWRNGYAALSYGNHRFFRIDSDLEVISETNIESHHLGNVNNIFELSSGLIAVAGNYNITGFPWTIALYSMEGVFLETRSVFSETIIDSISFLPYYNIVTKCSNGDYIWAGPIERTGDTTSHIELAITRLDSLFNDVPFLPDGVGEAVFVPEELSIALYPNPFNSALEIDVPLGAEIAIYDTQGRLVVSPGGTWKPEPDTPSGVFLVKATFEDRSVLKKAVYLK